MRVVIVGGGRIGKYVAKELDDFIIIERERVRAENLARELGEEHVMLADGVDADVLEKAGARRADALLAITNQDRTNLKVALAAKGLGVPRIIARCNDPAYIEIMQSEGVDNVICPAQTASRMIHSALFHEVDEITSLHVTKGSPLEGMKLGDVTDLKSTRALGVIRRKELLKPDQGLQMKAGDEVLICSLGGVSSELRQLMARETSGLLPFSNVVVGIVNEDHIETVGDESLYLASHLGNIPVEVHFPAEEVPHRIKELADIWGVDLTFVRMNEENGQNLSYLEYHSFDKNTLLAIGPGTVGERKLFKKCELSKILGLESGYVILCRRRIPYRRILAVYDGSERSMDIAEIALKIAIHTGSSLHVLDLGEAEGEGPDMDHLRRLGRSRDVEVKQLSVEGNPTLDLVALVTGGEYDLLAIRWTCQNVRRDILRKVVNDSSLSVLLVK